MRARPDDWPASVLVKPPIRPFAPEVVESPSTESRIPLNVRHTAVTSSPSLVLRSPTRLGIHRSEGSLCESKRQRVVSQGRNDDPCKQARLYRESPCALGRSSVPSSLAQTSLVQARDDLFQIARPLPGKNHLKTPTIVQICSPSPDSTPAKTSINQHISPIVITFED